MVLDDDREVHRGRDREVVGEDRVVVRAREGRRREHDRVRARVGRLAGVGDRPVRGRVRDADADRQVAGGRDHARG